MYNTNKHIRYGAGALEVAQMIIKERGLDGMY